MSDAKLRVTMDAVWDENNDGEAMIALRNESQGRGW